jgi:hypothetical protein
MIVVMMFELDDVEYDEIMSQDMHANDLADEVNEAAIHCYSRNEVFHLPGETYDEVYKALDAIYEKYNK